MPSNIGSRQDRSSQRGAGSYKPNVIRRMGWCRLIDAATDGSRGWFIGSSWRNECTTDPLTAVGPKSRNRMAANPMRVIALPPVQSLCLSTTGDLPGPSRTSPDGSRHLTKITGCPGNPAVLSSSFASTWLPAYRHLESSSAIGHSNMTPLSASLSARQKDTELPPGGAGSFGDSTSSE